MALLPGLVRLGYGLTEGLGLATGWDRVRELVYKPAGYGWQFLTLRELHANRPLPSVEQLGLVQWVNSNTHAWWRSEGLLAQHVAR